METPQHAADSSARRCSAPDSTGRIPSGCSCIYSHDCELKHDACNGEGCRVADGRISDKPFSCGYARLRKIVSRPNRTGQATATKEEKR